MLDIKNLTVAVDGKPILNGLNLTINAGEVHAIMGPNGSGKSTLASILAGREGYDIVSGAVNFQGQNLLTLTPEERAIAGLFLAFQYPVAIPGVNNFYFLRTALNTQRKARGEAELDAFDFLTLAREKLKMVGLAAQFSERAVNDGFSGGEKKRNEVLQMLLLNPALAILDETDSGLDVDAIKMLSGCVNQLKSSARSFLLITHYQSLLEAITPDHVHILAAGRIIKSGDQALASQIAKEGFAHIEGVQA